MLRESKSHQEGHFLVQNRKGVPGTLTLARCLEQAAFGSNLKMGLLEPKPGEGAE